MPKRFWTSEMVDYLREIATGLWLDEIVTKINTKFGTDVQPNQVKNKLHNERIKVGRVKRHYKPKILNQEQFEYFKEINVGRTSNEVTRMLNDKYDLNLKVSQIRSMKSNSGNSSGVKTTFKKGNIPINKGTKGMFNVGGNKTSFKKGQRPSNYKPVGSERIDKDGYIVIKVQDHGRYQERWRLKARVVWENANGPIPTGYTITFLDGNKLNCSIENLALVSMAERLKMNQFKLNSTTPELTKVGITVAKLILKESELKRKGGC